MNSDSAPHRSVSSLAMALAGPMALAGLMVVSSASLAAEPSPRPGTDPGSACWTREPDIVRTVNHPTDPTAVVLRMSVGGGFVPYESAFMEAPVFTLYGNDVVIFRPSTQPGELTDPLQPFACAVLAPDDVADLLTLALDEGGLREAREDYPNPFVLDAPSTTFTIDADGVANVVVVQALGIDGQAPDTEARVRFGALADILSTFEDEVGSSQSYDVPAYRAMLTAAWPEFDAAATPWPWDDSPAELFGTDLHQQATLTPEQVALVASVPNGGQTLIVLETPDGDRVNLTIRPLLPDEV